MKKSALLVALILTFLSSGLLAAQGSFADEFRRGYAEGQRLRYYREQLELMEAQRQIYEAELRRLEEAEKADAKLDAEVDLAISIFRQRNPDWKEYGQKMLHFAKKIRPTEASNLEYLQILYVLARSELAPKDVFDMIAPAQ